MTKKLFIVSLVNLFFVFGLVQVDAYRNIQVPLTQKPIVSVSTTPTLTPLVTPTPIIRIIKRIIKISVTANPTPDSQSKLTSQPPGNQSNNNQAQSPAPISNQVNTQTPTPTAIQNPQANRCIITIDGTHYDVTDFRNIHGGGDVFTCGSDMSVIFHNRHPNSYLDIMAKYKV